MVTRSSYGDFKSSAIKRFLGFESWAKLRTVMEESENKEVSDAEHIAESIVKMTSKIIAINHWDLIK